MSKKLSLLLALPLALWACSDDGGAAEGESEAEFVPEPVMDRTRPPLDPGEGAIHTSVMDALTVPADDESAMAARCDVDGDGRTENALGGVLRLLIDAGFGADQIQGSIDESIADGDVVLLWGLQADPVADDTEAGLQAWIGEDADCPEAAGEPCTKEQLADNFTGQGTFAISPESPPNLVLAGSIGQSRAAFGPAPLFIQLPFGGVQIDLSLAAVQILGTVRDDGSIESGVLCGGIPTDVFEQDVIPAVADLLGAQCEPDCDDCPEEGCPTDKKTGDKICPISDSCGTVLGIFDGDDDGTVSVEEVSGNSLIRTVMRPDADLFLGAPERGMGQRGRDCVWTTTATGQRMVQDPSCQDAISIGVLFTSVAATFDVPAPE